MALKISSFIISMILVGLVMSAFGLFMGDFNKTYTRSDYDNSTLESLNKLEDLNDLAQETQNKSMDLEVKSGITDIIGGYFTAAYDALRVSSKSITTFTELSESAAEDVGIPHAHLIKGALVSIVLILIFVGIIISAMVKKDV